jgi:hypothetical protein
MPFNLKTLSFGPKHTDASTPESSPGGPTYDARVDPLISGMEIIGSERLQTQRDLHLFDSKSAPAQAFSHAFTGIPGPLLGNLMQLSAQRDLIERVTSRKDYAPFPGVDLGHVPAFSASPQTNPILPGSVAHLAHGAHLGSSRNIIEQGRTGRRKFGH